jgi:hypothetical protein
MFNEDFTGYIQKNTGKDKTGLKGFEPLTCG